MLENSDAWVSAPEVLIASPGSQGWEPVHPTTLLSCAHTGCSLVVAVCDSASTCVVSVWPEFKFFVTRDLWPSLLPCRMAASPPRARALPKVVDCLISLSVLLSHSEDSLRGSWSLITSSCCHPQSQLTYQKRLVNALRMLPGLKSVARDLEPSQVQRGWPPTLQQPCSGGRRLFWSWFSPVSSAALAFHSQEGCVTRLVTEAQLMWIFCSVRSSERFLHPSLYRWGSGDTARWNNLANKRIQSPGFLTPIVPQWLVSGFPCQTSVEATSFPTFFPFTLGIP